MPNEHEADRYQYTIPAWNNVEPDPIHFSKLGLVLGWGIDAPRLLPYVLAGLRFIFTPPIVNPLHQRGVELMLQVRRRHYAESSIAGDEPPLKVFGFTTDGERQMTYALGEDGRLDVAFAPLPPDGRYGVTDDGAAHVRACFEGHGERRRLILTLERRNRRMADWVREEQKKFGLDYAPGVGKRSERADNQRTPKEQAFAVAVSTFKQTHVERRIAEMRDRADTRPANFDEQISALVRSRVGEIERGKRDKHGNRKVMYTDRELETRVIENIARLEATQLMFAYDYEPLYSWSRDTGLFAHTAP